MSIARDSSGRYRNVNWSLSDKFGQIQSSDHAILAVLMDIRDELQALNGVFRCVNFVRIPRVLDKIEANTRKETRKKATTRDPAT